MKDAKNFAKATWISIVSQPQNTLDLVELVRKWGNSNSDAVLDSDCLAFQVPDIEGFIGYKFFSNTAVAFGDPVASFEDQKTLALAFQKQFPNTVYIATSERFAKWALQNVCKVAIEFGNELFFNPHFNPKDYTGTNGSLVRRKIRHAEKENTTIHEYIPHNPELEEKILEVGREWLKGRKGPQIHISKVNIFENAFGKRWFYAQKEDRIVGVVNLNRLQSKNGYLLNHLMITSEASHGTPELLFVTVLEKLKEEGCSYVTVGSVPSEELGSLQGFHRFFSWIAHFTYKAAKRIFRFGGRSKFWEKFHPESKPSFVLLSNSTIQPNIIAGIIKALNGTA